MQNYIQEYGIAGFFDVETTGLSSTTDEIIECCLIVFNFNRNTGQIISILDSYVGLNEPSFPIPKAAQKINGITDSMVRGHRLDIQRLQNMMQYCEFFIAHNSSFDKGFLSKIFYFPKGTKWYCSMRNIPWLEMGFGNRKLQYLLSMHNLAPQNHRADGDVIASINLLSLQSREGRFYLSYILDKVYNVHIRQPIHYQSNQNYNYSTAVYNEYSSTSNIPLSGQPTVNRHFKRKSELYLIWLLLGLVGGHRFYIRDYWIGFFMLITIGGYGIWWIIDLFFVGRRFNEKFN